MSSLWSFAPDALFVGGGDGTIHHLLQRDLPSSCPVAVIPLGTANVLSYHLRGKKDPSFYSFRDRLSPVEIRLGESRGRFFLLMAGIGFDGRAVQKINPRVKEVFGSFGYEFAVLSTLVSGLGEPARLSVRRRQSPPETTLTHWAILRRFPFYYPPFPSDAQKSIPEHAFHLDVFTGKNRRNLCFFLLGTALGKMGRFWYRESCLAEEVSIPDSCPGQMDGEFVAFQAERLTVSDRTITLLFSEKGLRRSGIDASGRGSGPPAAGEASPVF